MCCFLEKKTPFKQNKIKSNEEIHEKNPIVGGAWGHIGNIQTFPSQAAVLFLMIMRLKTGES